MPGTQYLGYFFVKCGGQISHSLLYNNHRDIGINKYLPYIPILTWYGLVTNCCGIAQWGTNGKPFPTGHIIGEPLNFVRWSFHDYPCWLWQDFSQTPLSITARHCETYSLQCPLSHLLLSKFMRHQRFRELSSPFCHSAGRPLRDHSESANYRWLMSSPPSRPVISPVLLFDWSGWAAPTPMTSEAEV